MRVCAVVVAMMMVENAVPHRMGVGCEAVDWDERAKTLYYNISIDDTGKGGGLMLLCGKRYLVKH